MIEGSTTVRITSASIRTATASPTPICFISTMLSVPNTENTEIMTNAALVTTPADLMMPSRTASAVDIPRSAASLIRLTTKTW